MAKRKTTEQFIIDAKKVHGDKYNYKFVQYKNNSIKIKIICSIHGIFEQIPSNHLRGQNCPKCSIIQLSNKKRKTTEQFIIDAKKVHGDKYNYKLVDYKNNNTKIKIICPIHGVFEQKPNNHLNGNNCPKCRNISISNKLKKTTQQFIEDAYCKHGDKYNYKLVNYKGSNKKIKIICPVHGIFKQTSSNHLQGSGCPKCVIINNRKTIEQFIIDARKVHGDKYNYSLVQYKNSNTKVQIICPVHGMFEKTPNHHLKGQGCKKCNGKYKTTQQFIEKAQEVHGDRYDYSLVQYENLNINIKIICSKHGIFEQIPNNHLQGKGCLKCGHKYEGIIYANNNIPLYDTYIKQLSPYGIVCRRNKEDNNILEVKCMYCDSWYIPTLKSVTHKIQCINGKQSGESNLYCSNECKQACPTYRQVLYPKGYNKGKTNTSREVQPALRKLVLKRDNYTCQKCSAINVELHCHHYEGIEINPIESADADNCITLCKTCHNEIHKADKCGIKQYQRKECKEGIKESNEI